MTDNEHLGTCPAATAEHVGSREAIIRCSTSEPGDVGGLPDRGPAGPSTKLPKDRGRHTHITSGTSANP